MANQKSLRNLFYTSRISYEVLTNSLRCKFWYTTNFEKFNRLEQYINWDFYLRKLAKKIIIILDFWIWKLVWCITSKNRFGILKSQICMVGDRLDTDILFGQNGGCKTLLVLSGNLTHLPLSQIHLCSMSSFVLGAKW